jgi:hypothetical protein
MRAEKFRIDRGDAPIDVLECSIVHFSDGTEAMAQRQLSGD